MTPSAPHSVAPARCSAPGQRKNQKVDWLVSVRGEKELLQAIRFGVNIVDFKEPRDGALAPVACQVWQRAAEMMQGLCRESAATSELSAALGESDQATEIAARVPPAFAFAKAGPRGCDSRDVIRKLWKDVDRQLPAAVELVAVAYADHEQANCLDPESIFDHAKGVGLQRCLIDTFTKDGKSSLQRLGVDRLLHLAAQANELGLWWALAGSITLAEVDRLIEAGITPNCFAVRGDVCDQGRTGTLADDRLQAWRDKLQSLVRPNPSPSSL